MQIRNLMFASLTLLDTQRENLFQVVIHALKIKNSPPFRSETLRSIPQLVVIVQTCSSDGTVFFQHDDMTLATRYICSIFEDKYELCRHR